MKKGLLWSGIAAGVTAVTLAIALPLVLIDNNPTTEYKYSDYGLGGIEDSPKEGEANIFERSYDLPQSQLFDTFTVDIYFEGELGGSGNAEYTTRGFVIENVVIDGEYTNLIRLTPAGETVIEHAIGQITIDSIFNISSTSRTDGSIMFGHLYIKDISVISDFEVMLDEDYENGKIDIQVLETLYLFDHSADGINEHRYSNVLEYTLNYSIFNIFIDGFNHSNTPGEHSGEYVEGSDTLSTMDNVEDFHTTAIDLYTTPEEGEKIYPI